MIDVYVCTNLVNYGVALRVPAGEPRRRAWVLYEPWRFSPRPWPGARHLRIGIWSLRAVLLLARLGLVDTLYIPHDRFNKRIAAAARKARRVAYLDDGLDTLRRVPRNFDLPPAPGVEYFSFADYLQRPDWLRSFALRPVARLADLAAMADRPAMPLDGIDDVFFESPGLRPAEVIAALELDAARVLVVRHPVPAKRSTVPAACRTVPGSAFNPEATLLSAEGKRFYFGETMVLVFALYTVAKERNSVHAQLDDAQRANLPTLPLQPAGIAALPQLLKPSD